MAPFVWVKTHWERPSCMYRCLPRITFLALGIALIGSMYFPSQAQAQVVCGSKEYLDSLPVPPPRDSRVKRQIQLILQQRRRLSEIQQRC
jgi:hypothetical protein